MNKSNPFKRAPLSEVGDKDADPIFLSVGRALSAWEHTESNFANLYGTMIKPMYAFLRSDAVLRDHIISARA